MVGTFPFFFSTPRRDDPPGVWQIAVLDEYENSAVVWARLNTHNMKPLSYQELFHICNLNTEKRGAVSAYITATPYCQPCK